MNRPRLLQRLDTLARDLVPGLLSLALLLVSAVPVPIPGYRVVAPSLLLMAVYHWTIYRPTLLPPPAVFLLGLGYDILAGTPFGLSALTLLLVHTLVTTQRRFFLGKVFPIVWWGFALVAVATFLFLWIAGSVIAGGMLDPRAFAFQCLLTASLYPLAAGLFFGAQRMVMARA